MSTEKSNIAILKNAFDTWDAMKVASVQDWLDIMKDDINIKSVAEGAVGLESTEQS